MTARGESGFTVVELLVAMLVMLLVLGATLTSFNVFERVFRVNQLQNDAQQRARAAVDRLARDLRNQGSGAPERPQAVERSEPFDLVALSVAAGAPTTGNPRNLQRVRWCVEDPGSSQARLWRQHQSPVSSTQFSATACPDPAWPRAAAADAIVNGSARPVFATDAAALADIREVRTELFIDVEPGRDPGETRLASGVLLRNQNHPPDAAFSATPAGRDLAVLNASASSDPDGDGLSFTWYRVDGGLRTRIGAGVMFEYEAPDPEVPLTIALEATDPAGFADGASTTLTLVP